MSTELRGPIAPKDPTAKRDGFYIMRNKTICGAPQPDGRGVCFIYEDSGRLEASAKLVGNVEDEKITELMGTTEGFRKLVHSIGVSIKRNEKDKQATFAFQMYGKKDPYVTGTTLEMQIPADGMEYVLDLSKAEWSDDDNVPGQIRFEFDDAGCFAQVSVILYLNDGFKAPEQSNDEPIDYSGEAYKNIISKSLIRQGNNHRIKKALEKARGGEDITVAFIGGSITQGAGAVPINTACYPYLTYEGIKTLCGEGAGDVHYVKAGVGGTPSELGILRYESDVLSDGEITPDIVVVEFAVNDEGDETKGECYDSLVRKIYNGPGKPAVILMFAVFANDWNLEERLCIVGDTYDLPMVSARRAVVEQFYLSKEEGNVLSKSQFFYDLFHPTNAGHRIMADAILNMIGLADKALMDEEIDITTIAAPIGGDFEKVVLVDRKRNIVGAKICEGGFGDIDKDLQFVERNKDMVGTPEFVDNFMYKAGNSSDPLTLDVECKSLFVIFKDSASIQVGIAEVFVDGEYRETIDPHEVGWTHCNPKLIFRGTETKPHHVEVKIKSGYEDRDFCILGFGIVE